MNGEIKKTKGRPSKEKNYNSDFAVRLRELAANKTNQEIADGVGVSRQTIGQFILGNTKPDIDTLSKLSDYFGVSTDYLLCRTDVKTTDLTIKQICDYTGLSEEAITMLHYTAISSDKGEADIIRTMSILTPGLLALCGYLKSCGTQITLNNNLITERLQSTSLKDYMRVKKAEDNNDFLKWRFLKKCETLLLDFINNQSNTNE